MSKEDFVSMMTTDLPDAPVYFPMDAEINRTGAQGLDALPPPPPLGAQEVRRLVEAPEGECARVIILDVRSAADFGAGHVPGSINIGLGGQFAIWSGCLVPMSAPILIVAESEEKVEEAVMRLARVGIESVKGYLSGGIEAWRQAGLEQLTV